MFGAILGDMIGAPFEFDRGKKTKDFPMFSRESRFTDDTVMTIAVAEALMDSRGLSEEETKQALVDSMRKWGRKYPHAGYGGRFRHWLWAEDPQPYGSFGNGSAMRVAAAGNPGKGPVDRRSHPQSSGRHQRSRGHRLRHLSGENRKKQTGNQGLYQLGIRIQSKQNVR